jgi:prevent-host-death family protein
VRFVTVRELRSRSAEIWPTLADDDVVLTNNGRPLAVLVPVQEDELEATIESIHRGRALRALSRIRRQAARSGLANLTAADIDREVESVRRNRRR